MRRLCCRLQMVEQTAASHSSLLGPVGKDAGSQGTACGGQDEEEDARLAIP